MSPRSITSKAVERRRYWLEEIVQLSDNFGTDSTRLQAELAAEVDRDGAIAVIDHLRFCGNIPERYEHDSSEEKLYSKYTDVVLAKALEQLGLRTAVLVERGDSADVEAVADDWALVGDAKAFRLSRTAKNQKDFKVEAMHGWKRDRRHALLVCPSYQLPMRSSQIYQSAINRDVTIISYGHLAALVALAVSASPAVALNCLVDAMRCAENQSPTKDAVFYWTLINRSMLSRSEALQVLWKEEKSATLEVLYYAKQEGLTALDAERDRIQRMSREAAVQELMRFRKLDSRVKTIEAISDNDLLLIK
ncbi:HindIII family type II restriction endonuclease [Allosphingosinicella flava]|uniref:HindIII family type II restriction endonuclease n=1 Tax=Allosphingosinicella flava TaxID=2771430 RepID=A0A7T2LLG6_9SPHN|nr:HindIII family type II restriction endonuclease [Sphingosinicella flava]QPQ54476.1 HindIII family type II restriction endonuclease [Sphingosinicella flava]